MSAVTIRAATPADALGIAATFLESARHHARLDPVRYRVPAIEAIVARCGAQPPPSPDTPVMTLIAEHNGEIVGFVEARCETSPDPMHKDVMLCHVLEIAVRRRQRSRGIGAELLRAVEDWGRGNGAAFALLEFHAANTRAGEFYQRRLGYTVAAITAIKPL